jgi:hypothetical protein
MRSKHVNKIHRKLTRKNVVFYQLSLLITKHTRKEALYFGKRFSGWLYASICQYCMSAIYKIAVWIQTRSQRLSFYLHHGFYDIDIKFRAQMKCR